MVLKLIITSLALPSDSSDINQLFTHIKEKSGFTIMIWNLLRALYLPPSGTGLFKLNATKRDSLPVSGRLSLSDILNTQSFGKVVLRHAPHRLTPTERKSAISYDAPTFFPFVTVKGKTAQILQRRPLIHFYMPHLVGFQTHSKRMRRLKTFTVRA